MFSMFRLSIKMPTSCTVFFGKCNFNRQKPVTLLLAMLTILLNSSIVFCDKSHKKQKDFFSLSAEDIKGSLISFEKFRGKVSLVVNVATYCGFTRNHYPDLVKMQDILGASGKFNVLAFPCNQFGEQEPDTNEEIDEFLKDIYKVNFPVFSKSLVVGESANQVYQYLTKNSNQKPTWNFWKYLVDAKGKVLNAWAPDVSLDDVFPHVEKAIKELSPKRHDEM